MQNNNLQTLLDLNGERFVIDEKLGLWVKFEAREVPSTVRKTEVRYSLTLHNKHNQRVLGFDNAHEVEYGGKTGVAPKRTYEHWHRHKKDKGTPYDFSTPGKLLEDFWSAVENYIDALKGEIDEQTP